MNGRRKYLLLYLIFFMFLIVKSLFLFIKLVIIFLIVVCVFLFILVFNNLSMVIFDKDRFC